MQDEYETGYKKPPKAKQFKPGQSGNPAGRPKKSRNFSKLLAEELDVKIQVKEHGREKTISKREAIVKNIVNNALKGDLRAQQTLFKHVGETVEIEPFEVLPEDMKALEQLRSNLLKGADHGQ